VRASFYCGGVETAGGSCIEPEEDGAADLPKASDVGPAEGNSARDSSGLVGTESEAGGVGRVEVGDGPTLDLLVPEIVA
jgi:hypothetical protein